MARGRARLHSLWKNLVGVLKGHGFQPCRNSPKTMYGAAESRALSRLPAADFGVCGKGSYFLFGATHWLERSPRKSLSTRESKALRRVR
jgi:hypothetical protein